VRQRRDPVALAIAASLTGWVVHGLVDFDLYVPGVAVPAFLLFGAAQGLTEPVAEPAAVAPAEPPAEDDDAPPSSKAPAAAPPPAAPMAIALNIIESLLAEPNCEFLSEGPGHFDWLQQLATTGRLQGPQIHDARIAAICLSHGVSELWTADRDFSRFPQLRVRNPLVG
jgi:hypothetical protein